MRDAIILTGIKHCGKSTLGRLLAKLMRVPFDDADDVILRQTGLSPREAYLRLGEAGFRRAEEAACRALSARAEERAVIAAGGGICGNPRAFSVLRSCGRTVYLAVSEAAAFARIAGEITVRPDGRLDGVPAYIVREQPRSVADVRAAFSRVYAERAALYLAAADTVFAPSDSSPEANADALYALLNAPPRQNDVFVLCLPP